MDRQAAAALLGVEPDSPPGLVRERYRALLMQTHPDRNHRSDAAERTIRLTAAYRVLRTPVTRPGSRVDSSTPAAAADPRRTDATAPTRPRPSAAGARTPRPAPTLLGPTTIGLDVSAQSALRKVVDVSLEFGEVTYLDRGVGLLEVIVEFLDAPTSSVVVSVTARPTGARIDVDVEPLSGGTAPTPEAVTRFLLRELTDEPEE